MFISPKQAGQGVVTLGVAALTYFGAKKAFDTYNNHYYPVPAPRADALAARLKQANEAPKSIPLGTYQTVALRIITAASAIMFASSIGLISLDLATRFSTLFGALEAVVESAEKVAAAAAAVAETPVAAVEPPPAGTTGAAAAAAVAVTPGAETPVAAAAAAGTGSPEAFADLMLDRPPVEIE